ncbi:hypothetical protein [Mesorhizobium salmacidum]|uniref:Helix-turn-helix domain-containing protein n=1 Tax=Mesorhizobium salmacidum TaxID=3015171 RepID=A0ABU8KZC2_9HYPH
MSSAKPTLGYPSRTAAIAAFRAEGMETNAIAQRIGIAPSTVSALECSVRRFAPKSQRSDGVGRTVHLPIGLLQRLAPHARRRGLTRETLAWMIVDAVAESDLVDAVLDDAEELAS